MGENVIDCVAEFDKRKPALKRAGNSNKAGCTETIKYDEEGNVIVDSVKKSRSMNGSGFVISYTAKMCEFIASTKQGTVVRLFLYLAHNQQYGTDGRTYGYRCSHSYLQTVLGVDRKSIYNALSYLKERFLVVETREDGTSEFMVNPHYVTIGTDKRTRMRIWNERWVEVQKEKGLKCLQGLNSSSSRSRA